MNKNRAKILEKFDELRNISQLVDQKISNVTDLSGEKDVLEDVHMNSCIGQFDILYNEEKYRGLYKSEGGHNYFVDNKINPVEHFKTAYLADFADGLQRVNIAVRYLENSNSTYIDTKEYVELKRYMSKAMKDVMDMFSLKPEEEQMFKITPHSAIDTKPYDEYYSKSAIFMNHVHNFSKKYFTSENIPDAFVILEPVSVIESCAVAQAFQKMYKHSSSGTTKSGALEMMNVYAKDISDRLADFSALLFEQSEYVKKVDGIELHELKQLVSLLPELHDRAKGLYDLSNNVAQQSVILN